jgi:TatD family-associated radical SAM protein
LKRDPIFNEVTSELQKVINRRNWNEIVFCGFGEPMERLDCLLEIVRWIRKYYGKPVSIRLDTNGHGYLLNKGRDVIEELKAVSVNKVSVSLNAHDEETYNQVCRPKFNHAYENVQEFIKKAKGNFDIEVTAVPVPEVDIPRVKDIAQELGVNLRTRKYVPCSL